MNKINKLQDKAGYISMETVILAGLVMALGTWAWIRFYDTGEVVIQNAIELHSAVRSVTVSGA